MAFKLYSTDDGHVPAWEYLPVSSIKIEAGLALAADASSGLMAASATPTHICMRSEAEAVAEGTMIPCVKIAPDQVWENMLYNNATSAKVGGYADVNTTGQYIDAKNVTNSTFLITYLEGTTMASAVRGRFVK
ncbi:MAG: hypothetical protein IJC82_04585 [Firmicutes bacterium]|nr:hypothetical protein [Bacillota bacterium]